MKFYPLRGIRLKTVVIMSVFFMFAFVYSMKKQETMSPPIVIDKVFLEKTPSENKLSMKSYIIQGASIETMTRLRSFPALRDN